MRYIKLYEKFGEIDELFLGVKINKNDLENSIHDALVELVDKNFEIDVAFDDNLGIKVDIVKRPIVSFLVSEVTEQIDVLVDYIQEVFGNISVEYNINTRVHNLSGNYKHIPDFEHKMEEEFMQRMKYGYETSKDNEILCISVRFKKK